MIGKIVAKRGGNVRYVDIYNNGVRKVSVRPIAGRLQILIPDNYRGQFSQKMVNLYFMHELAILDNKTKRSIIVESNDYEKIESIASSLAKQI